MAASAADLTRDDGVKISVMLSEEEKYFMNKNSRQFDTLGGSAMLNFPKASILVIGMGGVGTETAKNIVLAGPGRVVIHDDAIVTPADLGVSFLLTADHIGKGRAAASLPGLVELNLDMKVEAHTGEITTDFLSQFVAVVITNHPPLAKLIEWDDFCRSKGITFILAQTAGAFTNMFSDFGDEHLVTDVDGENVITHNIQTAVVKDDKLILEVTAETHGLSDGDSIAISGCRGMEVLNAKSATIKRVYNKREGADGKERQVLDLKRFSIDKLAGEDLDLSSIKSEYTAGGIFSEVKPSKKMHFISLSASLSNPKGEEPFLVHPDGFEAMMLQHRSENLHFARLALWRFQEAHNGDLPRLHNKEDAEEVVALAEAIHKEHQEKEGAMSIEDGLDKPFITKAALYARAELLGLCTFLGGFAAQEVIKIWGKTTPVYQWQYVDFLALLSDEPSDNQSPEGSRYDHQVSLFGKDFQKKLTNQKWFLVGCGALGCEYLKGFSLMGIGSGENGLLHVTDYDHIELSNLTRQLLFRKEDLKKPKSIIGAKRAKMINPDIKVVVHEARVGPDTEDKFDDAFYTSLDGVCNALDNIKARQYTDSRIVFFEKPLLESGTLGTKCNSEIVIPHKTKCYRDDKDDETAKDIPLCTLRLFPSIIEHCLEWSRSEFAAVFDKTAKDTNSFVEDKKAFLSDSKLGPTKAANVLKFLQLKSKGTYEACLLMALDYFNASFNFNICDLTWSFPRDFVKTDENGKSEGLFWSGAKRFPRHADYDPSKVLDSEFLLSATNLFAFVIGLPPVNDMNEFQDIYKKVSPSPAKWTAPAKKVDDEAETETDTGEIPAEIKSALESFNTDGFGHLEVADFEKDDDSNYHIDFIAASANLRAWNYEIDLASRHKCKMIAGRITPALATTTALITGLVSIELCKLVLGMDKDKMRAANCNLALPVSLSFFEPDDPVKAAPHFDEMQGCEIRPVPKDFTVWDKVVINEGKSLTIKEFVDVFPKKHHNVQLGIVKPLGAPEQSLLWASAVNVPPAAAKIYAELESRNLVEVYEEKFGKLPEKQTYVILEASIAEDEAEELVKIPTIQYFFK